MTVQTLHTAAPSVRATARKPAAIAAIAATIREAFDALHDAQWRAPWDEPGQRRVNLR